MNNKITLVGGGLSGALLAILLARRGFQVELYERRPDLRAGKVIGGRSINLALSIRGIHALQSVGLDSVILETAVPMRGRMMHSLSGELAYQPYGPNDTFYINSVSRAGLNIALLNLAAQYENIRLYFNTRCIGYQVDSGLLDFKDESTGKNFSIRAQKVIGTDGSASAIRLALQQQIRLDYSQSYLAHGYKELTIPPAPDGSFRMEKHALHIWPRQSFMMIALPNIDATFTCTLFLAYENGFDQLKTEAAVLEFFQQNFPDAVPHIPDLLPDFFKNPTGSLMTVKCFPWFVRDKVLLLGDAAHAIVPFYGQGMNCSFEDCIELDNCIEEFGNDWAKIFETAAYRRKPNTDAIADLAVENFYEMRDHVANPVFQRKRRLELKLEALYPGEFLSKYAMVTFYRMPYAYAHQKGNLQDAFLMNLCANVEDENTLVPEVIYQALKTELAKHNF